MEYSPQVNSNERITSHLQTRSTIKPPSARKPQMSKLDRARDAQTLSQSKIPGAERATPLIHILKPHLHFRCADDQTQLGPTESLPKNLQLSVSPYTNRQIAKRKCHGKALSTSPRSSNHNAIHQSAPCDDPKSKQYPIPHCDQSFHRPCQYSPSLRCQHPIGSPTRLPCRCICSLHGTLSVAEPGSTKAR